MGPSGRRLGEHVVETSAKALIDRMRSIAGDKHLCMEEGTQSECLYEVLEPHAKPVVVTQPDIGVRLQRDDPRQMRLCVGPLVAPRPVHTGRCQLGIRRGWRSESGPER
jgi:hypothetical protein